MFTRFVECNVKPDKKDDFTNKLRNDVMPILQKQPGFVDLISLVSDDDPEPHRGWEGRLILAAPARRI
jgi:hypothetical protein